MPFFGMLLEVFVRGMTDIAKNKSVLVVEDDPTYLHLWERILTLLQVKPFQLCKTLDEAEEWLKNNKIDLLVCDVILPDGNGYQLAQELRRKDPKATILLTTGYKTDLTRFDLHNPSFHLLYKPYQNIRQLQLFVERLLSGQDPFDGADETSFSENEDYPEVTEWTL